MIVNIDIEGKKKSFLFDLCVNDVWYVIWVKLFILSKCYLKEILVLVN